MPLRIVTVASGGFEQSLVTILPFRNCTGRVAPGCAADLTATVSFMSRTSEFTPPVIYSLDERNKLVYLIQARPSRPDTLRVGQPISVFLNPRTPVADKR